MRVQDLAPPEVLFQLDSEPDKLFAFDLGTGRHRAARQGMLDLLSDALGDDAPVTIGYTIVPGRPEGVVVRASLARRPETPDTVRVVELPQLPRTADDPIVQGIRLDPAAILAQFPDPPPEFADKGAHELLEETVWTVVEESELGPGQTREETVSFAEPVLLQARASWFGSPGPLEMAATKDGTPLGTGKAHLSPPDRGTLTLEVQVHAAGSATVSIVNRGSSPARVGMVIGLLPLSHLPP
ncbi:MAG TPA: hypothetical protein VF121_04495 [Thermoanaerobaculia bacterium]|nr:hypothetical protein [Thermoanaerobaculia bacterium]